MGMGMGLWALLVASNKMIRKVFQDRCLHINPCAQCNPWFEFSALIAAAREQPPPPVAPAALPLTAP